MQYVGIIIHHSACSSINGKGYDFYISKKGMIIPATSLTDPDYIHICLEGKFTSPISARSPEIIEQLFLLNKLISRLSVAYNLDSNDLYPHALKCPGSYFPWSELVISVKDGYH